MSRLKDVTIQVCMALQLSASFILIRTAKWNRSTFFNMTILGLCNFSAPGIWGAMNSLGAGGAQSPHLVNAGNALTFCLMVVSCYFSSAIVHYIGIKGALIFGTFVTLLHNYSFDANSTTSIGYAPYAAACQCGM